ncbi:hypothetical protein Tco_0816992 [Tanacetum coccineum]
MDAFRALKTQFQLLINFQDYFDYFDDGPMIRITAAQHNVLTNEQQHTEQSKPIYNTYLLEKVDSNTTLDSINMSYRGGEIDQDAEQYQVKSHLLNAELFKTKEMIEKETYNELSHRFLLLEKYYISLKLEKQQKDASFQSNKPGKNQDAPQFHEIFEINDLKAQLQAKTTLICNLKNQIKSVKEASNEPKVKTDIDVIETINIELEHNVAKLIAANEQLHKENEHLKQTYKELYDSIKKTRFQNKENRKGFCKCSIKNELRKLKGNSVDAKFAKPSILGKPILQPLRNQSIVRQPTAFRFKRPKFSKPRVAYQVDVKNDFPKPITPHYFPKVRESAFVKPHHVIASGSSRNSSKESYGSNDMAHKYYLEVPKKKTQDKNTNLKPSVMHTTSLQNTTNGSKQKPRSNNQTSRSLPVPNSRNSSSFSDSKHFVCSTCQKCVFNANHDVCLTKFLKEVNSRIKVQYPKTRNSIKPVEMITNLIKPKRWISKGYRISPNKSSIVHEKPNTLRSFLRWKPTGRIFKIVGLRWIPTGKMFTDCTTKVDSEPPNGLNDDITNPYKCNQTLNVNNQFRTRAKYSISAVPPTKNEWDSLFQPMLDEYFKTSPNVDHPVPKVPTLVPAASTSSPSSTTVDQDAPSTSILQTTSEQQSSVIPQGVKDEFYDIEVAHMDNDPYFSIPIPEPNSEETTLQGVIPSNLHHLNQSFDTLTKLTKKHPLENVIGDPSKLVSTRSLLQEHAIWCYFDANDNPIPFGGKRSG